MATLREVLEMLKEPDWLTYAGTNRKPLPAALLDYEVEFAAGYERTELHILSTYVEDGILHVDVGE